MSVYDFAEIMKGKKAEKRAAASGGEKPAPAKTEKPEKQPEAPKKAEGKQEKPKEPEQPKRRGRPKRRPAVARNRLSISSCTSPVLSRTTHSRFGMMMKCGQWCQVSRIKASPSLPLFGPGRTVAMRSSPAIAARRSASFPHSQPACKAFLYQ